MKIAYFSPFPPKQTGIATYSEQLVKELRQLMEVECYDFGNPIASEPAISFGDFRRTGRINQLAAYDALIYNIGNNPCFHLEILDIMRQRKGIVILHDVVLYYLFAGTGRPGLIKHLWLNYGRERAADIEQIIADSAEDDIRQYKYPEKYALTASIFPAASQIIVHTKAARDTVISLGYDRDVHVIPHLAFRPAYSANSEDLDQLRQKHSLRKDELVIGCFGFIGRTKRIPQVCRALALLTDKIKFRFLVVGAGDDLSKPIADAGLTAFTIRTGFVNEHDFSRYLALTDILINLRYPSMGEASGTLTKAFMMEKPCIVTNDAYFSEIADDYVVKINLGNDEVVDLADAILKLAKNDRLRTGLGRAARRFAEDNWSGAAVADQFKAVIEADVKDRAEENSRRLHDLLRRSYAID